MLDVIKIVDLDTKQNIVVKMSEEYPHTTLDKEYTAGMASTKDHIFRLSNVKLSGQVVTSMYILDWDGNILGMFNMGKRFNKIWANSLDKAIYALFEPDGTVYKFDISPLWN